MCANNNLTEIKDLIVELEQYDKKQEEALSRISSELNLVLNKIKDMGND